MTPQESSARTPFPPPSQYQPPAPQPPPANEYTASPVEKKSWKELLNELEGLGITPEVIENNRDFVRKYVLDAYGPDAVAEMDAEMNGRGTQKPPPPPPPPVAVPQPIKPPPLPAAAPNLAPPAPARRTSEHLPLR